VDYQTGAGQLFYPTTKERLYETLADSFLKALDPESGLIAPGKDFRDFIGRNREDLRLVNSIAFIDVNLLNPKEPITALVQKAIDAKAKAIVLDLRRSERSLIPNLIETASLFLKDVPLFEVKDANGEMTVLSAESKALLYSGPLLVWTSQGTSGGAEVLAGALQAYKRALVVGNQTEGNPHLQVVRKYGYGKEALLSMISDSYLPNGSSIATNGILPDVLLLGPNQAAPHLLSDATDNVPAFFGDFAPNTNPRAFEEMKLTTNKILKANPQKAPEEVIIDIASAIASH
jgi:hypothetical protein